MPVFSIFTLTVAVSPTVIVVGTPEYETNDAPSVDAAATVIVRLVVNEPNHTVEELATIGRSGRSSSPLWSMRHWNV